MKKERLQRVRVGLYNADKMESAIKSRKYAGRGYTNLNKFLGLIPKFKTPHVGKRDARGAPTRLNL
jgi:hypothetical protein